MIQKSQSQARSSEVTGGVNAALEYRREGNFDAALEILERFRDEKGREGFACNLILGGTYRTLGRTRDAVEAFRKATGLGPRSEMASLGLFHSLWRLGRYDEAFDEVKRFQTVSFSQSYQDIVDEILEKTPPVK